MKTLYSIQHVLKLLDNGFNGNEVIIKRILEVYKDNTLDPYFKQAMIMEGIRLLECYEEGFDPDEDYNEAMMEGVYYQEEDNVTIKSDVNENKMEAPEEMFVITSDKGDSLVFKIILN